MATGEIGNLGLPAPKHVEKEHRHASAPVTTLPHTMEEKDVLEVVLSAKLAIRSAVLLTVSGMNGVHGLPA